LVNQVSLNHFDQCSIETLSLTIPFWISWSSARFPYFEELAQGLNNGTLEG